MRSKAPLVSVIMPAYNHEKYVEDAIYSIIAQTYKNIELIVLDDGSSDSTLEKIRTLEDKCRVRFENFVFKSHPNKGIFSTLKELISLANGEYTYIIASDDLAKSDAIAREVEFLDANPDFVLVVGDNEIIDSNGKICYWDENRKNVYDLKKAKWKTFGEFLKPDKNFGAYKKLYLGNHVPNGYLVKTSALKPIINISENNLLEDWFIMLQLAKIGRMKFLPEILFSYRWHGTNTIKKREKIIKMEENTRLLEEEILQRENFDNTDIIEIRKNGALQKKCGIPFIFEILTYRKGINKIKRVKIFNKEIK